MVQKFEDYICKYIQDQTSVFKKYLLAALDNQDQYLSYLDMSLGSPVPSVDVRNCEMLTDAKLFRVEIKLTRDGRNRYELFYLTDLGKEMAQSIRKESFVDEISESPPVAIPENE
jgi:hypothetical protein